MDELGLRRPASEDKPDFREAVTDERIADFDADILLLSRYPYEKETLSGQLKSNPLWPQLQAVKNNRFYEVDDDAWINSLGVRGANIIVDDLTKFVASPAH
jgi:iron complex transport system substrate-binding protein